MAVILAIVGYVTLMVIVLVGLGLVGLSSVILYIEYNYKDIPTPRKRGLITFFLGDVQAIVDLKKKMGLSIPVIAHMLSEDLGPVFRWRIIWKTMFVASAPEIVKELLLNSRHTKPFDTYRGFQYLYGNRFMGHGLVSEIDHEAWFHRRAIMNPAFRRRYLIGLMEEFNSGSDVLCQELKKKADGKTEVLMLDEINRVTLDIIAKISFSMETNAVRDPHCPFPAAITTALKGVQAFFDGEWIAIDPRSSSRQMRRNVKEAVNLIRETGRNQITARIEARKKGEHVPSDILNLILDISNDLEGDDEFDMENMLDEFLTLFIAGQETTSGLLAFTLLHLGRNPDVAKKLQTEVDEVLGQKPTIQYEDLAKLEYMMRVLKETLRMNPPALATTRLTAHPIKYKDITIPANTSVSILFAIMSRMKEYYDDPLLFNPDRFKPTEDGSLPKHLYAFFPFSMGQRSCIGQQFALIEARVVLAKLLQRFEFRLDQSQDLGILDELTAKPKGRCLNYLTLRS